MTEMQTDDNRVKKRRAGISIRVLGGIMIIAAALSLALTFFGVQRTLTYAHSLYELEQERLHCDKAIQKFMDGSDYLTAQVQQFVIQRDPVYMENYWTEVYDTRSRDTAMDVIRQSNLTPEEHAEAERGKQSSDSLIDGEIWAMRMVAESIGLPESELPRDVAAFELSAHDAALTALEKREAAIAYVFGPEYSIEKDTIRSSVNGFRNEISNRYAEETISALELTEHTTYMMATGLIVFFVFLFVAIYCFTTQVVSPLIAYSDELSRDEEGKFILLKERGAREIRQFVGTFNALSSQVEQNTQRLARLGYYDYLTDVPNRASITEYVSELIRAGQYPSGLMIIDIDNFKQFNDTYGHALGDRVLRQVAHAVCSVQPEENGISGRLCGEEFIVVTKNAVESVLADMAEKILQNVRNVSCRDVALDDIPEFNITVSIGGMIWRGDTPVDCISLLARADKALYVSKTTGKDRYTFNAD